MHCNIFPKGKRESNAEWLDIVFKYHTKFDKNNKSYKLWQRSNQPKVHSHPKDIKQKINYIHNNPVDEEIVSKVEDYLHSSTRN